MYHSRCDCTHERNADKYAADNGCCDEETDGLHYASTVPTRALMQ